MSDQEMHELLVRYVNEQRRLRFRQTREEFVAFVEMQIWCYGGDTTFLIASHYGDRLKAALADLITD